MEILFSKDDLSLIQCNEDFYESIRKLRLDPRVKNQFIEQGYWGKDEQIQYMNKYSNNYWVCLKDNHFVGFAGVIDNDIRICVDPDYHSQGIGKFMLSWIKNKFPDSVAKVKINNEASVKLFEKMGWKKKYYLLTLDDEK